MESNKTLCTAEGCENVRAKNRTKCQPCTNDYQRAWRAKNPDKVRTATTKYAKANPDKIRAYAREYYENNKDEILAKNKEWRKANPEIVAAAQRRWKEANEGHTYEDPSGYVNYVGYNHPIANPSGLTRYHRVVLWDKLGGKDAKCHWDCGKQLSWALKHPHPNAMVVDHVNAVKNDNRPENLVPSCQSCNSKRADHSGREKTITGKCQLEYCDRDAKTHSKNHPNLMVCGTHYLQDYLTGEFKPIGSYVARQVSETHRSCIYCEEIKPNEDFYMRTNRKGYQNSCKKCQIERAKARKAEKENRAGTR